MNEIKRLTDGVSASLLYDYCCMRGNLFGESYLTSSIGDILQSLHGGVATQVIAGYQHPILADQMVGSGRRPELDVVVTKYDDTNPTNRARSTEFPAKTARSTNLLLSAIEAKWAGSSHCTAANVIWDLIRLEMLVNDNPLITAIQLTGGSRKNMNDLRGRLKLEKLLPFCSGPKKLDLLSADPVQAAVFQTLFRDKSLQYIDIPKAFQVTACTSALGGHNSSRMSVVAWRVECFPDRSTFKPSDIPEYRTPG